MSVIGLTFLPCGLVLVVITVLAAASLKPLGPSGFLMRWNPAQVYHHHVCSFLRAVVWTSLLSFRRRPTPPQCPVTPSCTPVEDPSIRFPTSNSTVFMKILSGVLSFLRCSYPLMPRFFIFRNFLMFHHGLRRFLAGHLLFRQTIFSSQPSILVSTPA
jgi:hypothetical protein